MGTSTAVLQLYKPAGTEFVDEVSQLNDNWDRVENAVVADRTRLTALEAPFNFTYIVLASALTVTNSTTMTNIPGFSFPVTSGNKYIAESFMRVDSSVFTADGKIDCTFPSGSLSMWLFGPNNADLTAGTQANGEWVHRFDTASPTTATPFGLSSSPIGILVVIEVEPATSGTVQMRFAQNTAGGAGVSSTVNATSFFRWRRIA